MRFALESEGKSCAYLVLFGFVFSPAFAADARMRAAVRFLAHVLERTPTHE